MLLTSHPLAVHTWTSAVPFIASPPPPYTAATCRCRYLPLLREWADRLSCWSGDSMGQVVELVGHMDTALAVLCDEVRGGARVSTIRRGVHV